MRASLPPWSNIWAILRLAGTPLVAMLVALVLSVLTARVLGPAGRGQIALSLQIAYLLAPVLALGGERLWLRGKPSDLEVRGQLFLTVAMTGLATVTFWPAGPLLMLAPAIAMTGASLALFRAFCVSEKAIGRYVRAAVGLQVYLLASGILLFVLDAPRAWHWLVPYALPATVILLIMVRLGDWSQAWHSALALLSFRTRWAITLGSLASLLALRLDRLVLPVTSGYGALGQYIVVATASESVVWLATARADLLVGDHREVFARGKKGKLLSVGDSTWIVAVSAVGGALTWYLLPIAFGPAFAPAQQLVLPLFLSGVLLAFTRVILSHVLAGSRPEGLVIADVTAGVIGALVYVPAGILAGVTGVAWGTLIVYGAYLAISITVGMRNRSSLSGPT